MADGYKFHVDRTAILQFASALGEANRIYYDEAYARRTPLGGVIAPPTFAISSCHWDPNYGLRGVRRIPAPEAADARSKPGAAGDGAKRRRGGAPDLARVLHGEQRFEYHKQLRPGMQLTVTHRAGKSWEKRGRRGGKMRFTEHISEYRDANGELVVTTTSVGITTEKVVES